MNKVKHIEMSIEEWIKVKDCPTQRNTEIHAKSARKKNLKESSITHSQVSAAQVKTKGNMYKLDGHTRAYLWSEKILIPNFEQVSVTLYISRFY